MCYKNSSIKYAGVCIEENNVEVFVHIFIFLNKIVLLCCCLKVPNARCVDYA